MAGQDGKRVIEQRATSEVFADDWFLKDSVTEKTTKISSENLKAWINDSMATEEEIETIVENIADTYSTSESYVEGDLCIHEYALFKCTGTTTGTWDSTKWQATTVAELLDSIDLSADAISYDNTASGLEAENVQDAIDETITKLSAVGTASGDIATFTDGSALPMPKLEVGIEPVQDLHGYDAPWVGGSGKNKLNVSDTTISSQTYIFNYTDLNISSGTYTFSFETNYSGSISMAAEGESDTYYNGNVSVSGNKRVVTFTATGTIKKMRLYGGEGNYSKIMLEEGSTATSFAPYSNICPIIGWSEVNVSVSGVNVWDEQVKFGYYDLNDGSYKHYGDTELCSKDYIRVKGNTSYYGYKGANTAQGELCFYNANKTFISVLRAYQWINKEFTTPSNCAYITFNLGGNYGTTYNNDISINYPSTDTSYHAYNGQTYTIDLDGTRYGGKVDLVSGVMTVDRVEVDLGTLNWSKYGDDKFYTSISDIKMPETSADRNKGMVCSNYKPSSTLSVGDMEDGAYLKFNQAESFWIRDSRYTDATAFKTAMSGVQLVYELATPLTIQLTPTAVKSLLGVNNIFADTGDILDAEYIRDLTTIIDYILEQLNS